MSTAAVVGGGIAGLTAAHRLATAGVDVTLLDAADRPGGKLRRGAVGGVDLDVGADLFLARVPDALDLVGELGLTGHLVAPATTEAWVWSRDRLRPLPAGGVFGVPTTVASLRRTGAVSRRATVRAARDLLDGGRPVTTDVSVADYVGGRLGREVVDRLVEPVLGGVHAGRVDELSLAATMPAVAAVAARGGSLMRGLRERHAASAGPVFQSLRGGTAELAAALAARLGGRVRPHTRVAALERVGRGWRLTLAGGSALLADSVVLATPAPEAARLLAGVAPEAAAGLAPVEYADVAVVALAYPRGTTLPRGSGLLVPAVEGRDVKAVTFTTQKWPHLDTGGAVVVRASVGRAGAPPPVDDAMLVAAVTSDLHDLLVLPDPLDVAVTRWSPGLPQHVVGSRERMVRVHAGLPPGLAVTGAYDEGVGIPACIRSAGRAAARILGGE
jgi:protoporphyrinogen/coproporphyrinogen III oxidase